MRGFVCRLTSGLGKSTYGTRREKLNATPRTPLHAPAHFHQSLGHRLGDRLDMAEPLARLRVGSLASHDPILRRRILSWARESPRRRFHRVNYLSVSHFIERLGLESVLAGCNWSEAPGGMAGGIFTPPDARLRHHLCDGVRIRDALALRLSECRRIIGKAGGLFVHLQLPERPDPSGAGRLASSVSIESIL